MEQLLEHSLRLDGLLRSSIPNALQGLMEPKDLAQDIYLLAFRSRNTFTSDGPDAFWNWLSRIAKNHVTDVYRAHTTLKRDRRRQLGVPEKAGSSHDAPFLEQIAGGSDTPSGIVAQHEAITAMNSAMNDLEEAHRQVLELRYVKGLSITETAKRMGRSEGAVQMLCQRALARLHAIMGETGRFFSS